MSESSISEMKENKELLQQMIRLRKGDEATFEVQQYFENRADHYKDKMASVAMWLVGIQAALIVAPVGLGIFQFKDGVVKIPHLILVLPILLVTIAFTGYAWFYLYKINQHIDHNEKRSNVLLQNNYELLDAPLRKSRTYHFHKLMLIGNLILGLLIYSLVYWMMA